MRIVEIIPSLVSGGGERFVVDLCNELSLHNDVLLIVLHSLEKFGFFRSEISERVNVVSMNKKMGFDFLLSYRLCQEIRKFQPDIVHTHLSAINYAALSAHRNCRIVHCHTVHNAADKEAGGLVRRRVRRLLFKSKRFVPITISEKSHESFVQFYGMDAPMIFNGRNVPLDLTISNEVQKELSSYKKTTQTRLLVYLARIEEVKRQPMVARICKRLYAEGYDFQMLFIGCEIDEAIVESIKQVNCPCVCVFGERHNPLEYLKAAGTYCLLSSYEGMPISLIEAIGVGAIPVCTPVGGIVDTIKDGVNGILASDISEEACYQAIKRYLELPNDTLTVMRQKAYESYEPFSMTKCAENYEKLFLTLSTNNE